MSISAMAAIAAAVGTLQLTTAVTGNSNNGGNLVSLAGLDAVEDVSPKLYIADVRQLSVARPWDSTVYLDS
jgi:hypothetical protein